MIDDHKSMEHVAPAIQARTALYHILKRIHEDSRVGYYMGLGTESFALATEAIASLDNRDLRGTRELFAPKNPRDPVAEAKVQLAEEKMTRLARFSEEEDMALDEMLQLLKSQAAADYAAAAVNNQHDGYKLIQDAERKERLYDVLLAIKNGEESQ